MKLPATQTILYTGFAATLLSSVVFAALPLAEASTNNNVTINLSGTVKQTCSITAVTDPEAADIDLSTTQSNLNIATVTEACNNNGYTVTVSSQNGTTKGQPAMVGTVLNGTMNYTVLYGGAPVTFNGGQGTAIVVNTLSPVTRRQVGIGFTGNASLPSDSYTDTLTFTIAGK